MCLPVGGMEWFPGIYVDDSDTEGVYQKFGPDRYDIVEVWDGVP